MEKPAAALVLLLLLLCDPRLTTAAACPRGCTCRPPAAKVRGKVSARRVDCSENGTPFRSLSELSGDGSPSLLANVTRLDLSNNAITVLQQGDFLHFSQLQKLDLSKNQISEIEPGAFDGLQNLMRLDLSDNRLTHINGSTFIGLEKVEKLFLSRNMITTVPDETFSSLVSLRKMDFRSSILRCDCHLQWIVKWLKESNVQIRGTTVCATPLDMKGRQLKDLKRKDLHCEHPLNLRVFQLLPSTNQIVFEGDKLPFQCRAAVVGPETKMFWIRGGEPVVNNRSAGIFVHQSFFQDRGILIYNLVLENLAKDHQGIWECRVTTPRGNNSKSVNVVVIPSDALYCTREVVRTIKGVYLWKKTVAGIHVEQQCNFGRNQYAKYFCNEMGTWENLDLSKCEYIVELTRKLSSLAQRSIDEKNAIDTASEFQSILSGKSWIQYSIEVTLVADIIDKLVPYVQKNIYNIILEVVSKMAKLNEKLLVHAQRKNNSCSRLVKSIKHITQRMLLSNSYVTGQTENVMVKAFNKTLENVQGMACYMMGSFTRPGHHDDQFTCGSSVNLSTFLNVSQKGLSTSILLPKTLFTNSDHLIDEPLKTVGIEFSVHRVPSLFPIVNTRGRGFTDGDWQVVSMVISGSVGNPITNLSDPVVLTFQAPALRHKLQAVYWDFDANNGLGDWRTDGCEIVDQHLNTTVVHCYHLTNFAILQDLTPVLISGFMMMEPVIYIGSCVCVLCTIAVMVTYITCFKFIRIPKKMKHSVININISILLLIIAFTMGINRVDHRRACQIVGIGIHYFSLCAIFWLTITSNNMLKKFTKAERPPSPPPEPLLMPLPPKPMLRFYLLGWGVPLIICGITAAVNLDHYAGREYCYLSWDPGLGAFYGPVALLVAFNLIFFMRISCVIRGSATNPSYSEETEELHVNEIELAPNHEDTHVDTHSLAHTDDTNVSSNSSIMDEERRPITQLRALVVVLFLFIVAWVCAAFAVAKPFRTIIPKQELIFSYFYGLVSVLLGGFLLGYFCLMRDDARASWKRFFCCEKQAMFEMDTSTANHIAHVNGHVRSASSLETESLSGKVYNIERVNQIKADPTKQSNIIPPQPASFTDGSISSANYPNFYNPRQNGVAKKFWEKNRHTHLKLINKDMNKDINGSNYTNVDTFNGEQKRYSQGASSDANTHWSIEIQIQANPDDEQEHHHHLMDQGLIKPAQHSHQLPLNIHATPPLFSSLPFNRNQIPPVGGATSPETLTESPSCSFVSPSGSQTLPHCHSPGTSSVSSRHHPSAFTLVQPKRCNTLPRAGKVAADTLPITSPDQYIGCDDSQDFDGQSVERNQINSGSSECHVLQGYLPPEPSEASTCQTKKTDANTDSMQSNSMDLPASKSSHQRAPMQQSHSEKSTQQETANNASSEENACQMTSCGCENKDESDATAANEGGSFVFHESDSQLQCAKHTKSNDSDHHSDPTHRRRHRHSRHGISKQRSLDWEEQFKNRPRKIPYAYVNHSYQKNVVQKLLKKCNENGNSASSSKHLNWFPRSFSSYANTPRECIRKLAEDSASSSEDSFDDMWLHQVPDEDQFKKETSV